MPDRTRARELAREHLAAGKPLAWFDALYQEAAQGKTTVPWAELKPNEHLMQWLDRKQMRGEGKSALVIGCGYGDDAEELARRGFHVTAFDISPTAIDMCLRRHAATAVQYQVADLLQPPPQWRDRFHFIVEAYTLQAMPVDLRARAIRALPTLLAPGGTLLLIARGRDNAEPLDEVPWPLARLELEPLRATLRELSFEDFMDNDDPPARRFRAEYARA